MDWICELSWFQAFCPFPDLYQALWNYVKTGKWNHLIWKNLQIPTIYTNVEVRTAYQHDFLLTVPKAPRKPFHELNSRTYTFYEYFLENELLKFNEKDSIENLLLSLKKTACLDLSLCKKN